MENNKEIVIKEKKENPVYRFFDSIFLFKKRKTNTKTEIFSGLLAGIALTCTSVLLATLLSGESGLTTTSSFGYTLYFIIALFSGISSILIGLVTNVPLSHSVSMGVVSLFISVIGANSGLTYWNVLAISFVSNLVYLLVMAIPFSRNFILKSVPSSIKKAMPAMVGLMLIVYVLLQFGILKSNELNIASILNSKMSAGDSIPRDSLTYVTLNFDFSDKTYFYSYMSVIIGFVTLMAYVLLSNIKIKGFAFKHPLIESFGIGLLIYLICWAIRGNFRDYYLFSFLTPSYGGSYYYTQSSSMSWRTISSSYLGAIFSSGFDFSAYKAALAEGSNTSLAVFSLFFSTFMSFLMIGVSETGSVLEAHSALSDEKDENGEYVVNRQSDLFGPIENYVNVYSLGALTSLVGSFFGVPPLTARVESLASSKEGGRTGLTSIVSGIIMIVSAFTFAFAGIFINGMVVYGVLLICGLFAFSKIKDVNWDDIGEFLPAIFAIIIAGFTMNFVLALGIGTISDLVLKLIRFRFKEIKIGHIVLSALLLLTLIF